MRTIHFKRDDVEYPILWDAEVAEQIQNKYGNLVSAVDKIASFDFDTTAWVLHLLIQEGVLYRNDMTGMHEQPPTPQAVKRLITHPDLRDPQFIEAIVDTFKEFMGGNVTGQQLAAAGLEMLMASMLKT